MINSSKFFSFKSEEEIDDFFLPIYVVNAIPKFSDLVEPSNFLFLIFTFSETELTTNTLASVDPSFLALDKH